MQDYDNAIKYAADLLRDGSDPEYRRGLLEIMSELFAVPGVFMADRMEKINADIDRAIREG